MKETKVLHVICTTIGIVAGILIFAYAISLFFLIFAGILLALFLEGLTSLINRYIKLPYQLTLVLVILALIIFLGAVTWIATPLIAGQLTELIQKVPLAYADFKQILSSHLDLKFLTDQEFLKNIFKDGSLVQHATQLFTTTVGTILGFVVFIFVGIYTAFNPYQYVKGFLTLFPPQRRAFVDGVLSELGKTLKYWIVGKFISMVAIGILTTIGLRILNVPLAFILGLIAGILTFIPYLGAVIAAIPAILIGFSVSPLMALYVIILYMLIHAIEGYGITPMVEQRTVSLPPALTISVQIILSLLVGFIGLALASPFTAIAIVLIKELYVKQYTKKKSQ